MGMKQEGLPERPQPCPGAQPAILYLDLRLPARLRAAAQRHYKHLAKLAATLRVTGLDEAAVRHSLDLLVDRYRTELAAAVADPESETIHG